ncbi:MAG: hypothetical protein IPI97_06540 [Nitrosomonas sp.]|nr:hypothetical protein [Nitrosomonas sp.]MBK7364654.1 hypothetical protein [Nitrosomonas sp.]
MNSNRNHTTLVLVADPSATNLIARRAQPSYKAFSPINRKSMIVKVLDTLSASKMFKPLR